jgi:sulfatase maturation enzyme AslB (radical SAM superfamily)
MPAKITFCGTIGKSMDFRYDSLAHCCTAFSASGIPKICDFEGGAFPIEQYISSMKQFILQNSLQKGPCAGCHFLHVGEPTEEFTFFKSVTINHFSNCNLNCYYCQLNHAAWRKKRIIPYDIVPTLEDMWNRKYITDQTIVTWGGGEPSIYKYLNNTLNFLSERNIHQHMNTNAVVFSPEIATVFEKGNMILAVSPDSGTKETYLKN